MKHKSLVSKEEEFNEDQRANGKCLYFVLYMNIIIIQLVERVELDGRHYYSSWYAC